MKSQSLSGGPVQVVEFFGRVGFAFGKGKLYRTADFGENWVRLDRYNALGTNVRNMAMVGTVLFAGTWDGVFRSADKGESWTRLPQIWGITAIEAMIAYKGALLVVDRSTSGVNRYSDSAAAWIRLDLKAPNADFYDPKIFAADDSALYIGGHGLIKSLDGGTTWMDMMPGLNLTHTRTHSRSSNGYVYSLVSGKAGLFASLIGGIYRSTDGGSSWSALLTSDTLTAFYSMDVAGDTLLAGTHSDPGWRIPLNSSPPSRMGFRHDIDAIRTTDSGIFLGTFDGLYRSVDGGRTWNPSSLDSRKWDIGILTSQNGILHAGARNGPLFRSTDYGVNWSMVSQMPELSWIVSMAWNGKSLFAVPALGIKGMYASEDDGTNWHLLGGDADSLIFDVVAASAGTLYAAVFDNRDGAHRLLRSEDQGRTWKPASDPIDNGRPGIYALAIGESWIHVGTDSGYFRIDRATGKVNASGLKGETILKLFAWDGRLFACGAGTPVWRSQDEGLTWEKPAGAVPWVGNVMAFAGHAQTVYAGTYGSGVYRTMNGGSSWEPFDAGELDPQVSGLAVDGGRLYAGTSASVYSLELEIIGISAGQRIQNRKAKKGSRFPYLQALQGDGSFRIITLDGRQVSVGLVPAR